MIWLLTFWFLSYEYAFSSDISMLDYFALDLCVCMGQAASLLWVFIITQYTAA
jgi:hypothetical protein